MKKGFKFGALTLSLVLMGASFAGCTPKAAPTYKVTYEESTAYTISGIDSKGYKAGATVTFTVTPTDRVNYVVKEVKYDETTVQESSGSYSFSMPSKNVALSATLKTRIHFVYNENQVKDGMTTKFQLCDGTEPMTGVTIVPDSASASHVTISSSNEVTFEVGYVGDVTLIARQAGEEVYRETLTVTRHAKGTIESDPITAAEANAIGKTLQKSTSTVSYPTDDYYYIRDVVSEITSEYSTQYSNLGCYLGEGKEFLAFRCVWTAQSTNPIVLGSYITYKCRIINFNDREIEDYTPNGDSTVEHKAISVDSTEVRLIRFSHAAKTVKKDVPFDAHVQAYPTTAPLPAGGITYTYSTANVATCVDGVITGTAVGDTNVVANLTVGTRKVTGIIHIFVQEEDVIGEDVDHPLNAAQAAEIGGKLDQNGVSEIFYYIEDTINEIKEAYDPDGFKNITCFIGDSGEFEIYRLKIDDTTVGAALAKGSIIKLGCNITRYYSTIENAYGTEEFISADSTHVHRIEVECDALFAGDLYVKPDADPVAISAKSYPEALEKPVTVVIADAAVATYDETNKKIVPVAAGETTVTLTSDGFVKEITLHVSATSPKGSQENPYTVAEVVDYLKTGTYDKVTEFCVTGRLKSFNAKNTDDSKKYASFYMRDPADYEKDYKTETFPEFYGFKISYTATLGKPAIGEMVVIKGQLTVYGTTSVTYETNNKGTLISHTAYSA